MIKDIIKVLVVDDSKISRDLLIHVIEMDPKFKVIGFATNGDEALEFLKHSSPDIITMDIVMPQMDGFEATRRILEKFSIPIVVVSGIYNAVDINNSFKALEAGALAILEKPRGISNARDSNLCSILIDTLKAMSEVKVVRRPFKTFDKEYEIKTKAVIDNYLKEIQAIEHQLPDISMIGIGTSLGGPQALHTILSSLPRTFPVPIVIVQHIAPGFVQGLAEWLNASSQLKVKIAEKDEEAVKGYVYLAPDKTHMEIGRGNRIRLVEAPPEEGHCPSVARLFRSMALSLGPYGVGILLTGMGRDGAEDLLSMKKMGAITIAQNKESCIMFGMPEEAIHIGAPRFVLPLHAIPGALIRLTQKMAKKI